MHEPAHLGQSYLTDLLASCNLPACQFGWRLHVLLMPRCPDDFTGSAGEMDVSRRGSQREQRLPAGQLPDIEARVRAGSEALAVRTECQADVSVGVRMLG